jgi:hypothetical protein
MSIKIKNSYIVLCILGIVALCFLAGYIFAHRKGVNEIQRLKLAYSDSVLIYKVKLHGAEMTAYQMTQLVVSQKTALKEINLKNSDLEKLNIKKTNEISQLKLEIDTLLHVEHNGQIVIVHDTITKQPHNAILLPFKFYHVDKWMPDSLTGNFNDKGILTIKLKMEIGVAAIAGTDMQNKPKLTLLSDNPYIKNIKVESYKTNVVKPKKWDIGFQAGYGFVYADSKVSPGPFVGAGLSRRIVSF